jgi:hypothetical protein
VVHSSKLRNHAAGNKGEIRHFAAGIVLKQMKRLAQLIKLETEENLLSFISIGFHSLSFAPHFQA